MFLGPTSGNSLAWLGAAPVLLPASSSQWPAASGLPLLSPLQSRNSPASQAAWGWEEH